MGESRCELLESSSKMFYVIFHQETDPKVKELFYEIIYCKCGAQKRPVLQGLIIVLLINLAVVVPFLASIFKLFKLAAASTTCRINIYIFFWIKVD